jgi:hypothetical protein
MRVNRRFLYWGIFLVAIGGVLVVADLRNGDTGIIADALRFWPLAIVAIGLGLVLRRTRFGLPAGMLAAAVPGLVLGGSLALAPRLAGQCGGDGAPSNVATHEGTFDGPAQISVSTGCGNLVVDTAPGSDWRLDAGNAGGRTPIVDASARTLSIGAGGFQGLHAFDRGRDTWRLTLPTSKIDGLLLTVNAGEGRVGLPGATIGRLELNTNAGHTSVDLSEASVASLSGTVDAGLLSIHLPTNADLVGSLDVNAGALQVCVPSGLGLRIHHVGALSGLSVNGSQQNGTDWSSPDYASAAHHADLNVTVNLGGVEIDPIGGCK